MKFTIGITGGIGSGKSVVARICRNKGFPVYDCDIEAKQLMDSSAEIKRRLSSRIHESCIDSAGAIDRVALGNIVFHNPEKLRTLNEIVHGEVRKDFIDWRERQANPVVFVETAIPVTSHLDQLMDQVWLVVAPAEERVKRVMLRNNVSAADVEKRIGSQNHEFERLPEIKTKIIDNGGAASLLLRIDELLNEL